MQKNSNCMPCLNRLDIFYFSKCQFKPFQATDGKNTAPKPGMMDFVKKAKWDAWAQLGDMSKVSKNLGNFNCFKTFVG